MKSFDMACETVFATIANNRDMFATASEGRVVDILAQWERLGALPDGYIKIMSLVEHLLRRERSACSFKATVAAHG